MPLILSGNVASATVSADIVSNSCRFNAADSVRLYKTGSTGNRRTWTWSCWLKRCTLGSDGDHLIFGASSDDFSTDYLDISFTSADKINIQDYQGSEALRYVTNRVFRDVSAWMNIVIRVDTTQGAASNRLRIYINGTEETSFSTETDPSQDTELLVNKNVVHQVGGRTGAYGGLYMAECVLIDGSSLAPTSFGEFDSDSPTIWKPIDVSGLTFGTNGFYLDFEDSANLGNDVNGGTDLTESNLAAADQATDTPVNNFCTLNPLVPTTGFTFSEGNCKIVSGGSDTKAGGIGTFGMTNGKWYWEVYIGGSGEFWRNHTHGVVSELTAELYQNVAGLQNDVGVTQFRNDDGGEMNKDGTQTTNDYGTLDIGDILGVAFNADDNEISFYDNGSLIVDAYTTSTTRGTMFTLIGSGISTTFPVNFGGCPSWSLSSAVADENGYGAFEYTPPSGFLALCTKNLAEEG